MSAECLQTGYVCPLTTQTPVGSPVCVPAEEGGADADAEAEAEAEAEAGQGDGTDESPPSDATPQGDGAGNVDAGAAEVIDASSLGG
jgi:hypothetical protein